jgi:hypothetical protein
MCAVGYFGVWLVVKTADVTTLERVGFSISGEGASHGWLFADGGRELRSDLSEIVAEVSLAGGAAAGAQVFDSDAGEVIVALDGRVLGHVTVNAEAAKDVGFVGGSDPDAFSAWSLAAPRRVSPAQVREVLARDWTFAEEAILELLERRAAGAV